MINRTKIDQAVSDLTTSVGEIEGVAQSATALINGIEGTVTQAVTAALTEDNAADQNTVDTTAGVIAEVFARYRAGIAPLIAAVNARTTPPADQPPADQPPADQPPVESKRRPRGE
jgi:hypothetical protein